MEFLENLDKNKPIKIIKNQKEDNLDFYILDRKAIIEISKN